MYAIVRTTFATALDATLQLSSTVARGRSGSNRCDSNSCNSIQPNSFGDSLATRHLVPLPAATCKLPLLHRLARKTSTCSILQVHHQTASSIAICRSRSAEFPLCCLGCCVGLVLHCLLTVLRLCRCRLCVSTTAATLAGAAQQMQQALAEGADVVELRLDLLSEAAAETPEGVVSAAQLEQLLAQRPSQIETFGTYRSVAN